MRPTVLVTSPTSILGGLIAKTLAQRGYNLVLLSWRSDLAEKLMLEIMSVSDVKIMIIRHDLGSLEGLERVWERMRTVNMTPDSMVKIPLVEENTKPARRSNKELFLLAEVVRNNLTKLSHLSPSCHLVDTDVKIPEVSDVIKQLFARYGNLWNKVSLTIKSLQNLVTVEEAETIGKRVCALVDSEIKYARLGFWDYRSPLTRIFLLQLTKLYGGRKIWQ